MYLCYIDESGTPDVPGNTSHFILAGLSVPIWHWRDCDREIERIKRKYAISEAEIHVAWMLRPYIEQTKIPDFDKLDYDRRRSQVISYRTNELLRLQRVNNKQYKQTKKNYAKTLAYVHLTYEERQNLIQELAEHIARWGFARLFAECVDKVHFDPARTNRSIGEQSFEQVISRFEQYLQIIDKTSKTSTPSTYGLLIHDNNETVARKHTELMKRFHQNGTLWTEINKIIETPLFVDSQLTSMVQIADLCAYSLRRYLENGETKLFDLIFQRADRKNNVVVGVRHFTARECNCTICNSRKQSFSS